VVAYAEEISGEARAEAELCREAYAEGHRRGDGGRPKPRSGSVGQSAEALRSARRRDVWGPGRFIASLEPQIVALVKDIARRVLRAGNSRATKSCCGTPSARCWAIWRSRAG